MDFLNYLLPTTRISIFLAGLLLFFLLFWALKWLTLKKGRKLLSFLGSISVSMKQAVIANSNVKEFVKKHPLFFNFLRQRLDKTKFSGLPLTFLVIAFLWILFLLGGIIEDFITSDPIVRADIRIANLLFIFRDPYLTKIFLWITLLGEWQIILAFTISALSMLWLWKKRIYIGPFLITILGSEVFKSLGKIVFHRPRPEIAMYAKNSFSFPSGHATIAVAFYGFLVYVFFRKTKKWKNKINFLFSGLLVILAIGFSRLYLGMHYLSDVWSGYLLGLLWLIIGISLSEWLIARRRNRQLAQSPPSKKAKNISFLLLFLSLTFYGAFSAQYNPKPKTTLPPQNKVVLNNILDIFSNYRLSKYTKGLTGERQEPLDFIVAAQNDQQLINAFRRAGWHLADKVSIASAARFTESMLANKEYLKAPMTPSFWNTKVHAFGFEKPTPSETVRQRHHARFWRTQFKAPDGEQIYVGTASLDIKIEWGLWGFTHKINPDIDTEREFLFNDLKSAGLIAKFKKEQFVEPTLGQNFSGDLFFTDGKIYIIELK